MKVSTVIIRASTVLSILIIYLVLLYERVQYYNDLNSIYPVVILKSATHQIIFYGIPRVYWDRFVWIIQRKAAIYDGFERADLWIEPNNHCRYQSFEEAAWHVADLIDTNNYEILEPGELPKDIQGRFIGP